MHMGWIIIALSLFVVIDQGEPALIRLVPGTYAGRLEVYHGGEWGTVCDDGFDMNDAKVVCRAFGLNASSVKASAHYGQGSGDIMMDDLACTGTETSLDRCSHRGWRSHNCGHGEDVGVECVTVPGQRWNQGPAPTRLISPSAGGRLEVFVQSWGTVCRDRFDENDAETACRALGLPTNYAYVVPTSFFGSGSGEIWVDELQCSGSEASIDSCPRSTWGVHNCNHDKDVGIICASTFPDVLRYTSVSLSVDAVQVLAGTSQTVTCNVKTPLASTITYTWTVGGIINGTSSTFTKVLVNTDNDKELTCRVRSGGTELGTASVSLNVLYPPDVSCQDQYFLIQGTDGQLICTVNAMPSPTFLTWSRGTTNMTSLNGQYFGLKISKAHPSDGGVYECRVSNTMITRTGNMKTGNGSCAINVEILYPPRPLVSATITVFESDSVTFPFSSNPPPHLYKWKKDGLDSSFTTTVYPPAINNTGRSDAGTYVITATNMMNDTRVGPMEGHGMHIVSLNVLYPPEVFCQENVSVLLESSFDLTCKVSASPLPDDVTWTRLSIQASTISPEPSHEHFTPSGSGEMETIQVDSAEDTGEGSGDDTDQRFSWILSNTSINSEREVTELRSMNTSWLGVIPESSEKGKIGTYHVQSAAIADAGVYQCTAVNSMLDQTGRRETGTGSCLTSLNVLYAPPPLKTGIKDTFEGASVILSLPPDSNPPPHIYTWKKEVDEREVSSNTPPMLSNIRRSDAGTYIVTVTNSMNLTYGGLMEGHGIQLVQINVLYSPVLSCQSEYVVIQNSSVSLRCSVEAFPTPSVVRWRRETSDKTLMTGDKFTMDDVQMTDGGVYVCTAINSMTDYTGQKRTGTGSCAVRVKVTARDTAGCPYHPPKSYHPLQRDIIYIVGGVFVVVLVVILVITFICFKRKLKRENHHDQNVDKNGDIPLTEIPGVTTLIYKQM
ncbi:uncharacterized protein [Haliotis asinina]|uniref:uncharacterized protein n=1 Tax=Haliotis asinina TaxID=109174 RepID=UPI00353180C3